ncbi:RecX family transcriptional regulator [Mycoplasmatota bacterium zrk1]
MVKILKIELKGTKYIVTTEDGEYKFTEDVIIKYIISKNKQYSKEQFAEIVSFSNESMFYNKALKFLSYKDRSTHEVSEYLISKGCIDTKPILNKLKDNKLLDDSRYALNMLESVIYNKKGPIYLKQQLILKKINEELINEVIEKYTYKLRMDNLNLLIDKELGKRYVSSLKKYLNQLRSRLSRSGFKLNEINDVLSDRMDEIKDNIDEDISLLKEYQKLESKDLPKHKLIARLCGKGFDYQDVKNIVNK